MKGTSCEECAYFEYDEDEESYGCQFFFDEDDIAKASLYGDRYICLIFNIEMNTNCENRFNMLEKMVLTNDKCLLL
ncbi:MAG: DUF6472 family protein [Lachnospiraceae bacterium]